MAGSLSHLSQAPGNILNFAPAAQDASAAGSKPPWPSNVATAASQEHKDPALQQALPALVAQPAHAQSADTAAAHATAATAAAAASPAAALAVAAVAAHAARALCGCPLATVLQAATAA